MIKDGARIKALHGHFAGTVDNICWLAPEVLAQDICGYSFQSDVYSVGIAALELATGEAPFAGLPVTEVFSKCDFVATCFVLVFCNMV
jgi:serine/threonine protein kinase